MVHFPMVHMYTNCTIRARIQYMRQYSLHSWRFFVNKRFSHAKGETRTKKEMIKEGVRGEGNEK